MSDYDEYSDNDGDSDLVYSDEDDYNSEDDEFLAFHDAEIEAQVRAEIEKMKFRRTEAEKENAILIESTDQERVLRIKELQVELLGGSEKLFERINHNLQISKFEAYFAREQFKLFSWREDFFHEQFSDDTWFTDGADDSHSFDTVPFQITQNFDNVVALACAHKNPGSKIYFENDEGKSARARNLFDSNTVMYMDNFLEPESLEDHGLSFTDALHIIAAVFSNKPLKLEHLAMKKTLELKVSLEELPRELKEKAAKGMFITSDQVEDFIDEQGKETLEILKTNFQS